MNELMQYGFFTGIILWRFHISRVCSFVWLSSVLWNGCTVVCVTVHLLEDIWVVSSVWKVPNRKGTLEPSSHLGARLLPHPAILLSTPLLSPCPALHLYSCLDSETYLPTTAFLLPLYFLPPSTLFFSLHTDL